MDTELDPEVFNKMPDTWKTEAIASLAQVVQDEPEPNQLASHLALNLLASLDCRAVAIGVISKEGFLDLIGYYGLSKQVTSSYNRMPLWAQLPMTESARTGEYIFIKSNEELVSRFPQMIESIEYRDVVTVTTPVRQRGTVIGSIAFSSMKPPSDDFYSNPMTHAALAIICLYIKNYLSRKVIDVKDFSDAQKCLSNRQRQIIELFREELTTDQMANRLRFSPSTIKQDIIKIYEIFEVNSREEVVSLAHRAGLLKQTNAS